MCLETRLMEIQSHLSVVVKFGLHAIEDEIDRHHIIDALTEATCALRELRNAPRAALVETLTEAANV